MAGAPPHGGPGGREPDADGTDDVAPWWIDTRSGAAGTDDGVQPGIWGDAPLPTPGLEDDEPVRPATSGEAPNAAPPPERPTPAARATPKPAPPRTERPTPAARATPKPAPPRTERPTPAARATPKPAPPRTERPTRPAPASAPLPPPPGTDDTVGSGSPVAPTAPAPVRGAHAYPGDQGSGPRRQAPPLSTAAAFTDERMLRPHATPPQSGWRRLVHRLTGGRVTPPPTRAELVERELVARVTTPVKGSHVVAVISRKGGVGKTTTTLMLGHTFASRRGDRVVALDGNPDAGSLGYRVRRETEATVTDLLADAGTINRYADLREYTSQTGTRLEVVASDDDPHITQAFGRNEYRAAVEVLERHYNLILLDTGTGILDSATQGILQVADSLVVVMAPSLDGARAASLTLDWLEQHDFGHLAEQSVAVLNQSRRGGLVEVERLEAHFAGRCRATVRIPWDPHLDAGAETDIDALRPATRDAYLRLAATVADGFGQAGGRRS